MDFLAHVFVSEKYIVDTKFKKYADIGLHTINPSENYNLKPSKVENYNAPISPGNSTADANAYVVMEITTSKTRNVIFSKLMQLEKDLTVLQQRKNAIFITQFVLVAVLSISDLDSSLILDIFYELRTNYLIYPLLKELAIRNRFLVITTSIADHYNYIMETLHNKEDILDKRIEQLNKDCGLAPAIFTEKTEALVKSCIMENIKELLTAISDLKTDLCSTELPRTKLAKKIKKAEDNYSNISTKMDTFQKALEEVMENNKLMMENNKLLIDLCKSNAAMLGNIAKFGGILLLLQLIILCYIAYILFNNK